MPLDFPTSPAVNDQYTFAGRTWVWNGSAWDSYNPGITAYVSAVNGFTGGITLAAGSGITLTGSAKTITISTIVGVGATGPTGPQGNTGNTGATGAQGEPGQSSTYYNYTVHTTSQTPPTTNGEIRYNNATQTSSTTLYVDHLDSNGDDIDVFLSLLKQNDNLIIQDANNSNNYQTWKITSAPTVILNDYTTIPVTGITSAGTGTSGFANNHQVLFIVFSSPIATAYVESLRGLTGAIGLTNGNGIDLSVSGNTLTVSNSGVLSFNGLTGAVTGVTQINASTGISITGTTNPTITNTGVQSFNGSTGAVTGVASFNGDTGAVRLYIGTVNKHESRGSGITAQSDNSIFTDFVGNNFSAAIGQAGWLGQNANGGSYTISTASITSYGFDKCNGVVNFITGTTDNTTGYAACLLQANHIPGIPTPSNGFITKYEIECRFMTDSDVTSQNTKTRIGFADTWTNVIAGDGVYFERHYDSLNLPTETKFQVVFRNGAAEERIDTGVTFSASTIYRTYLCVERDATGTLTTTWEILNDTTNVTSTGTAAPTNTARYPTASTDYINPGCIIQKTGSVTTATSRLIRVDYIGTRIRRPLNRSMKLFA